MIELTPFPLTMAAGVSPADWLAQYDSTPRLLPRWPKSRRMTLVGVSATPEPLDAMSQAFVITDPSQAAAAMSLGRLAWLFFSVPRAAVLDAEVRPAALKATDWVDEFVEKKKSE